MHGAYLSPVIRELRDQNVHSASRQRQIQYADRAEELLGELKAEQSYTYQYVHFRITGSRPAAHAAVRLTGRAASHDLRLFVEDVSEAAGVPADAAGQRVLTVEQLARQFNVSTKTISRWRRQGLISRRFVMDGRKRVGFLQSSVDRFVADHGDRIRRGGQFSQLSDEERAGIIRRARLLARAGRWPADVTKSLARETGRSVETIRYTLKQFDAKHPDAAIFPYSYGPLRPELKQKVYQQHRRGESVEALAKRFCRSKTSICRIIAEMRARRILDLPLDYIPHPQFAQTLSGKKESKVLGPMPVQERSTKTPRPPAGLPAYLASLYEMPLLTREQEAHLFRRMNYLKYKASVLREQLDPQQPKGWLMDQIERLYEEAVATKNQIVCANLRLVVSIAKRHVGPMAGLFELVSDGNVSLIRAVEKFDFARGNKFSTYASWAIMKNFARTVPDAHRHRDRFRTGHVEMFSATEDGRSNPFEQETVQVRREAEVEHILERLDERERTIIVQRFGLQRGQEPLTLKELGATMGVTKERVRQLEARAMKKLRQAAEEERIEVPGLA